MGGVGSVATQNDILDFAAKLKKEDPGSVANQKIRETILKMTDPGDLKELYQKMLENDLEPLASSIAEMRWAFLGLNVRLKEANRKLVLEGYLGSVTKMSAHGQFFFKYFDWYMTPIAVNLEELNYLKTGLEKLLATEVKKEQA